MSVCEGQVHARQLSQRDLYSSQRMLTEVSVVCSLRKWSLKFRIVFLIRSSVGTRRLCRHNFEHNRYLKALSIMLA